MLQFLQVPLLERLSGFRQLQNIKRHYWIATLAFDFTLHIIVCLLVVILAVLLDKDRVFSAESYRLIFSVLLLYGLFALVVVYIVSQTVDSANTAMTVMSYLMITAGKFAVGFPWCFYSHTLLNLFPSFYHSWRSVSTVRWIRQHKAKQRSDLCSARGARIWTETFDAGDIRE